MNRKDIVFYVLGKKYNFDIKKYYQFAMENQYWSNDRINDYQCARLNEIITHAYENVPYYTNLFNEYGYTPNDFREPTDLKKLPILRKETIRSNFQSFIARDFQKYHPMDRYTGGTTGAAFHLYNDINSWAINWATKIRTFSWGDYDFGNDKLGVMAGGSLLPARGTGIKNRIWRHINNYYSMPITRMDDIILSEYIRNLKKKSIKFLRGYPSAIYTLALFLEKTDSHLDLTSVFTTAEMLLPHQRQLIEERFNCKCFDQYGCADGMGGANECDKHTGLHVNIETSLMNIIDEKGNEVENDKEGEIILTSFHDKAMPLIRYAPGDLAIRSAGKCSCGRNLPLLKKIIGRTSDLIVLSNGIKLNGLSIPFEAWSEKIERFQIIQTKPDAVEVHFIKKNSFSVKDEKQVLDLMKFHCGQEIDIKIKYVDFIPLPRSGKFRYVISLLNDNRV